MARMFGLVLLAFWAIFWGKIIDLGAEEKTPAQKKILGVRGGKVRGQRLDLGR